MISLEECREILGDEVRGLSDAELEFLRQRLYGLANIAISIYLDKRAEGVILPSEEPPTASRRFAEAPGACTLSEKA